MNQRSARSRWLQGLSFIILFATPMAAAEPRPAAIKPPVAAAVLSAPTPAMDSLQVGFAEADITPPQGFWMAGYYFERRATGTLDPLKAKAIVFRGSNQQAALVVCDLTGIAVDLTQAVRAQAAQKTGIPRENIIVTATHSHTAPDYTKDLYRYLASAPAASAAAPPYAAKLIGGIVDAVARAAAAAEPVTLAAGSARQETPVSFNRRFVMSDGTVRTWMRLDQPGVVRAAGPIDPEIGILLARSAANSQPLGLLSNFALHLDTLGGTRWSADYPYYIERAMRQTLGTGTISVFGTGCCGDINHADPVRPQRNTTDFIGTALARTIAAALPRLEPLKQPALRVAHATVAVPLQPVSTAQLERARRLLAEARTGAKVDFFEQVTAYKSIVLDQLHRKTPAADPADQINWGLSHTWGGIGASLPVEVHALCLGNEVAIVCLPGEVFVELGLAIKRASPFKRTFVIELADCVETMYIPTRVAYAGGGYEVTNSALQPGSGEMLAEAAVRLLQPLAPRQDK